MIKIKLQPDTLNKHGEPYCSTTRYLEMCKWVSDNYSEYNGGKWRPNFKYFEFEDAEVAALFKLTWC